MTPTTPAKVGTKPVVSDKDVDFIILVIQSLKTEPVVDFDKLAQLSGMASKASASTKWYKLRQKYMPSGISPKKRKDDGGNDSSAGDAEAKAAKKPRTPRKSNKTPKKEDSEDEGDKTAVKADPFRVKSEEDSEDM